MVDADRTEGYRLLTGPTGILHSIIRSIEKYNIEQGSSKVVDKTVSQRLLSFDILFPEKKLTELYLVIVTRIAAAGNESKIRNPDFKPNYQSEKKTEV